MDPEKDKIIVFRDKRIRRTWYSEEWWFSVKDIVNALVDSADIKQYIHKMRQRDPELNIRDKESSSDLETGAEPHRLELEEEFGWRRGATAPQVGTLYPLLNPFLIYQKVEIFVRKSEK